MATAMLPEQVFGCRSCAARPNAQTDAAPLGRRVWRSLANSGTLWMGKDHPDHGFWNPYHPRGSGPHSMKGTQSSNNPSRLWALWPQWAPVPLLNSARFVACSAVTFVEVFSTVRDLTQLRSVSRRSSSRSVVGRYRGFPRSIPHLIIQSRASLSNEQIGSLLRRLARHKLEFRLGSSIVRIGTAWQRAPPRSTVRADHVGSDRQESVNDVVYRLGLWSETECHNDNLGCSVNGL